MHQLKFITFLMLLTGGLLSLSCNNTTQKEGNFKKIEEGMAPKEVINVAGKPTHKITLGVHKATGDTIQRWHYNNKAVMFKGKQVSNITYGVDKETKRLIKK